MTPGPRSGEDSATTGRHGGGTRRRRSLALSFARQKHGEAASFPLVRLGGHATAVGVRNAARDRQAQTRATPFAVGLTVGVEDVRQRVRRNADTRVFHLELELRARG